MKKLIFILAIILSITVFGQKNSTSNTVKLPNGNYKEITYDSITGTTFTDKKGNVYPVFKSKTGKLYYPTISKNSKYIRRYLKL